MNVVAFPPAVCLPASEDVYVPQNSWSPKHSCLLHSRPQHRASADSAQSVPIAALLAPSPRAWGTELASPSALRGLAVSEEVHPRPRPSKT